MSQAKVAGTSPTKVAIEPGAYAWCACGESKNQPFCDGSHRGSTFVPLKFTIEQGKDVFLCMCKATKNPPFCDGSHKSL